MISFIYHNNTVQQVLLFSQDETQMYETSLRWHWSVQCIQSDSRVTSDQTSELYCFHCALFIFCVHYLFGFWLRLTSGTCYRGSSVCMAFWLVLRLSPISHQTRLHIFWFLNHPTSSRSSVTSTSYWGCTPWQYWKRIILSHLCIINFTDFFFHLPRSLGYLTLTFNWTNSTLVTFRNSIIPVLLLPF